MVTTYPLWIQLILNGVLFAIVLTFPLLLGLIFLSIIRRGIKKDREIFETRVISLLEEIHDVLNQIKE